MLIVTALTGAVVNFTMGRILDLSHHQYRYSYMGSCVMATLSLVSSAILYRRFMRLGGPRHYKAP